jgi:hypothetical protein
MTAGLLAALLVGAPATAADNGLTVLATPPASSGKMRLQVEVTDPALQQELRASGASPNRFHVVVDHAGAQVGAVTRLADTREGRYTVLAFDQSGSFSAYWPRAFGLARAYADALGARPRNHTVAVMTFGKSKTTHCEATSASALGTCLDTTEQLGTQQPVTRLKFYIQEAMREAARKQPLSQGGSREVIVFTDAGEESNALSLQKLIGDARDLGVRLHLVVFSAGTTGKGAARRLDEMSRLATGTGGRYLQVEDVVSPEQELAGLVGALEHLYWLDVAFCGVKPRQTSDRLFVEALSGGNRVAWSDPVTFRQSAEGSATAACPKAVATGPSPTQPGHTTGTSQPGTSGSTTAPGTPPGASGSSSQPGSGTASGAGSSTGSPSGSTQPGATTGAPGTPSGGGVGAPGAPGQPGAPGAPGATSGLPWWLLALGLGLLLVLVLIVLLSRRRSTPEPVPAPVQEAKPVVPPAPEPPPAQPEPAPVAPAVWKDPFATLPETRLVVTRGPPGLEPFYRVHKSSFTIGARSGDMDLTVNLPQLSGHHATVQLFKAGNVFVKDENSTNGTFVDGRRLNPGERVAVKPGQTIRLSQHLELTLDQPGLQPTAAPVPGGAPLVEAPPVASATAPEPTAQAPRVKARTIYAPAKGEDE